ncbi:hypothetical protein Bca52824_026195 [Brassica carinata]|uniref:At2g35280-like TPR domain-containing protein n=1 Tax=Brassica carinata TaxID=52824 RepID=A0A8X7SI47_BRACI|nr:hypothetical protein Bca52824_026195 [Brassica carinata]
MDSDNSVNNYNLTITGENSCYDDYSDPDPASYFRNISLRYFCADPLKMLTKHKQFKEICLANGNPEAHYIEGLLQFFCKDDIGNDLYHLRQSSNGNNENGMYLYGLLNLALGNYRKGTKFLDKLNWQDNISTSDHCWERIKNSLRDIRITWTIDYYTNMVNLKPWPPCHPQDNMALICNKCYYYKRLNQLYEFAIKDD